MKIARVELEDYQAKTLIKVYSLSENPSEEELGNALISFLNDFDNVMDALGEEFED